MQHEQFFDCPACGATISVLVDLSLRRQAYIEDCEVCCRPLEITCEVEEGEIESFSADVSG